jgi:hypothetical protein
MTVVVPDKYWPLLATCLNDFIDAYVIIWSISLCGSDTWIKADLILASLVRTDMDLQNPLRNQTSLFHETLENEFSGDDPLKDVKIYIPMECDQRVIIKFLFSEWCDAN